ncbi:hypothetical protein MPER_04866, partial [Moniliophthora perniciosa FA553]
VPVWLARPLGEKETVKVDKWINVPLNAQSLYTQSGGVALSFADASTPYAVVYEGRIDPTVPYRHYKLMAQYLASVTDQNAFLPSDNLHKFKGKSRQATTGPARSEKVVKGQRTQPYGKTPTSSAAIAPPVSRTRNKFQDVESVLMPWSLHHWERAALAA